MAFMVPANPRQMSRTEIDAVDSWRDSAVRGIEAVDP